MKWMVALVLAGLSPADLEERLRRADAEAAAAVESRDAKRLGHLGTALDLYAELIRERPKDRRWVPRIRRRRASLLRRVGRLEESLREYERILAGPARRRDRARAHLGAAKRLQALERLKPAGAHLRRILEDFRDVDSTAAEAGLRLGQVMEERKETKAAVRAYRLVVDRYKAVPKHAIAAYDAWAQVAIRQRDPRVAARVLRECEREYAGRAKRKDRFGLFLARLLAGMKAPRLLALARRARARDAPGDSR